MALTKRDQIQKDYADAIKVAAEKHLKAVDKARRVRDSALAALDTVGKAPKRSKPDVSRQRPKRRTPKG